LGAVSSLVVNKLKEQVLPGLPIDVIRFDSGGSAGGLAASRLEVGKYLTDNIYVSYVHQFGEPAGLRRVNSNEAQLDYRFAHHYEIDTVYGDAGVGAADLYWTIRY
jgi:translocation and assembly module TamB